ncbi:NRAMP family divalent metal transporter [Ferroacidibacillus organovorans]|uniref:NRAMP family divalent metal transporter n=1 Tax=Ferroacidibacillus organovorans TaxID=1765683 RepID=UPI000B1C9D67|nr:divalent metal cation transporter [Ferroacidibacillus organovorans]
MNNRTRSASVEQEIANDPVTLCESKTWTRRLRAWSMAFWLLMGPGLLAMIGDNDAGGVVSYAVTGATFGLSFFIPLVLCLSIVTYTIQEMTVRLGAVTKQGFAKLVYIHFGKGFGRFQMVTLLILNLLTLMTEFIGMTAGLTLLGWPLTLADGVSFLLVVAIAIFTGYFTKERLALLVGALNIVFLIVAILTHPNGATLANALFHWSMPVPHASVLWFVIATVGNALAPWMIFFQGSAVIDKGVEIRHLKLARIDTALGSIIQVIIAAAIMICGAVLYQHVTSIASASPALLILALAHVAGRFSAILFGFGLFNAGFLASITISLSSSWTIAETLGWARSLNDKLAAAPRFYAVYIGSLALAAGAILIPHLPLNFTAVLAQVAGGVLIAPTLIFLIRLTSNEAVMGAYRNGTFGKTISWTIALALIGLSAALLGQLLF